MRFPSLLGVSATQVAARAIIAGLVFLIAQGAVAQRPPTNAELRRKADAVLARADNVQSRAEIAHVFTFADRLLEENRSDEALKYLLSALKHDPWNLKGQMLAARLQGKAGQQADAESRATTVYEYAETDSLIEEAARVLRKKHSLSAPELPNRASIFLVPVGSPERWLVAALQTNLSARLNLPVSITNIPIAVPQPRRDAVADFAAELRPRLKLQEKVPAYLLSLEQLGVTSKALTNDAVVFAIVERMLTLATNRIELDGFRMARELRERLGPQHDAADVINELRDVRPASSRSIYIAVVPFDIFTASNRFLFGLAHAPSGCAVVSYRRFSPTAFGEPPNRAKLLDRAVKQALSSTGLAFGLDRCSNPTCPRAYPNNLPEHDAKTLEPCKTCSAGFDRVRRSFISASTSGSDNSVKP